MKENNLSEGKAIYKTAQVRRHTPEVLGSCREKVLFPNPFPPPAGFIHGRENGSYKFTLIEPFFGQ